MTNNIESIRERLAKATPGPWKWGSDWAEVDETPSSQWMEQRLKYADLQLTGGNGADILPLRIDHHTVELDHGDFLEPKKDDRNFIAHAPSDIAFLLAEVSTLRREKAELREALGVIECDAKAVNQQWLKAQPMGIQLVISNIIKQAASALAATKEKEAM